MATSWFPGTPSARSELSGEVNTASSADVGTWAVDQMPAPCQFPHLLLGHFHISSVTNCNVEIWWFPFSQLLSSLPSPAFPSPHNCPGCSLPLLFQIYFNICFQIGWFLQILWFLTGMAALVVLLSFLFWSKFYSLSFSWMLALRLVLIRPGVVAVAVKVLALENQSGGIG